MNDTAKSAAKTEKGFRCLINNEHAISRQEKFYYEKRPTEVTFLEGNWRKKFKFTSNDKRKNEVNKSIKWREILYVFGKELIPPYKFNF